MRPTPDKMSDVLSRSGRNRSFHYLSQKHNRHRLFGEMMTVGMHMDTDGFTRCYRFNPFTKMFDRSKTCRKCDNGQYASIFYCVNSKNVDTGDVKLLPISKNLLEPLSKCVSDNGNVMPNDLVNGYVIDIERFKQDNQLTWKVNKIRDEKVAKSDFDKGIHIFDVLGIDEKEYTPQELGVDGVAEEKKAVTVLDETSGFAEEDDDQIRYVEEDPAEGTAEIPEDSEFSAVIPKLDEGD